MFLLYSENSKVKKKKGVGVAEGRDIADRVQTLNKNLTPLNTIISTN